MFKNADSGSNHGLPSGFFADSTATQSRITVKAACLDDPSSVDGDSSDADRLDRINVFDFLDANTFASFCRRLEYLSPCLCPRLSEPGRPPPSRPA